MSRTGFDISYDSVIYYPARFCENERVDMVHTGIIPAVTLANCESSLASVRRGRSVP